MSPRVFPLVSLALGGCFAPAFNPAWKTCTPAIGCPSGYTCVPSTDGGVCTANTALAFECDAGSPDWVFCSGFEEGSFAIWDDTDGNPPPYNTLVEDPGPFDVAGNHVMRLWVPPGPGRADVVKLLPGADALYARWYVKFEAPHDFTLYAPGSGLVAGGKNALGGNTRPNGTDYFSALLAEQPGPWGVFSYYPGMYQRCPDGGPCFADQFPCGAGDAICTRPQDRPGGVLPQATEDQWHCLELELSGGAATATAAGADGGIDFWIDGQEVGPWSGLWMRASATLQPDVLWLQLQFDTAHPDGGVLWDNVVVSRSRVGCP